MDIEERKRELRAVLSRTAQRKFLRSEPTQAERDRAFLVGLLVETEDALKQALERLNQCG